VTAVRAIEERAIWSLRDVRFVYGGAARAAIDGVSLDIARGSMTALIGPNGAGKSTLLQLILGLVAPLSGAIDFDGRAVHEWARRDFARAVGVVPQGETEPLFSVREIVAMGRYPHLGPWQRERAEDLAAIERAMRRCDVLEFSDRWLSTLSGGERQRVRLARALAQEPRVLVLDEPTTYLDIRHEMVTFELLHGLRAEGTSIVLATHNLNLAARYADVLVMMHYGRIVASGTPASVLTATQVSDVYEWPVSIVAHEGGAPQIDPRGGSAP
jgi:iron complex transport system ATP-binding protein